MPLGFKKHLSRWLDSLPFKLAVSTMAYILLAAFLILKIGVHTNVAKDFDRLDAVIVISLAFSPVFVFFAKSIPWWTDRDE